MMDVLCDRIAGFDIWRRQSLNILRPHFRRKIVNRLLLVALLASIGLSACGKKDEAAVSSVPPAAPVEAPVAPAAPAAPVAAAPAQIAAAPVAAAAPAVTAAPAHPAAPVAATQNTGKVVQILQGGGYTYAEVDTGAGKKVWIAGSPIQVKSGESVQWGDYSIMQNFSSKTLNRTFDEILFVNAWGPVGSAPTPVAPHGSLPSK